MRRAARGQPGLRLPRKPTAVVRSPGRVPRDRWIADTFLGDACAPLWPDSGRCRGRAGICVRLGGRITRSATI